LGQAGGVPPEARRNFNRTIVIALMNH
jgi:hypothetical protein